jgi:hypothetical protein
MLNLLADARLPRRHVRRLLALLILDVGKPDAAEIRLGVRARRRCDLLQEKNADDRKRFDELLENHATFQPMQRQDSWHEHERKAGPLCKRFKIAGGCDIPIALAVYPALERSAIAI